MAMLFQIYNGPRPTTAVLPAVTTGTAIKTMLQIRPGTTVPLRIVEWGISFDGSAAAVPVAVELIETDVAATVTAHVAAGIQKLNAAAIAAGDPTTALFQVGTTGTGYTGSAEGSITDSRLLDGQLVAPTNQFVKQFPLGREPVIRVGSYGRIRVHAPVAVNALCYVTIEVG